MPVFFNEFHYDNDGADVGEFFELAGTAGTDLTGWTVVLYNGSSSQRSVYDTIDLSGTFADESNGWGFLSFDRAGIQNGAPDGMALVDAAGNVVEFISYEGSFEAVDGPAAGMISTDIGVSEASSTPIGYSLQRTGTGLVAADFTWAEAAADTKGALNTGQSFGDGPSVPSVVMNEIDADQAGTDSAEFVELYDGGAGFTSLDGLVLVLFNGNGDTSYDAIDLTGHTTDENGFFVVGSDTVPNVDLVAWTTNGLQNGADGIALVQGSAADFPSGTSVDVLAGFTVLDSLVYGTSDADDPELLAALGGPQADEGENGDATGQSLSRLPDGSGGFIAKTPTPGEVNDTPPPTEITLISAIQGATDFSGLGYIPEVGKDDVSVLAGQVVTVRAIVTADFQEGMGGFFLQEEAADDDGNAATSEGIFVFDSYGALGDVQIGDFVELTGTVSEYFGLTQIGSLTSLDVLGSGLDLPPAVEVAFPTTGIMKSVGGGLIADLEAYEGMRITIAEEMTLTEMFNLDRFGEVRVSEGGKLDQFTQVNDPDADAYAAYLEEIATRQIVLDDGSSAQNPDEIRIIDGNDGLLTSADSFRMGDSLTDLTGVVHYGFDQFRLQAPTGTYHQNNTRPDTPEDVGGNLKVASMNVLNFFTTIDTGDDNSGPNDDMEPRGADDLTAFGVEPATAEFERQVAKTVNAILEIDADILGLVEIENDDDEAVAYLVDALNAAAGAGTYAYIATGDVGSDAITNAIIYKPGAVLPVGDVAILTEFEGRDFIDPLNSPSAGLNRPAVAQTFEHLDSGQKVTVAVNHLKSKGSESGLAEDQDQGDGQGNNNASREAAADILGDWLNSDPTGQGAENTLILGDLNSYAKEDPIKALEADGYTDVAGALLGDEAYSYVFDGQWGTLDYIMANAGALEKVTGITEWHVNSDEADALDYNLDFGRDPSLFDGDTATRNSDHDPVIIGLQLDRALIEVAENRNGKMVGTDADELFRSGGGLHDRMTGNGGIDFFVFGEETYDDCLDFDRITDFEVGIDRLVLENGAEVAEVYQLGNRNAVVRFEGGMDTLFIHATSHFDADELEFIYWDNQAVA